MMPTKMLTARKRELLLAAFAMYRKKAEQLAKGVDELGLSAMTLETAIGHVDAAAQHVLKSKDGTIALGTGMEDAFRGTARDALAFNLLQLDKVEKKQLELLVEPADTQETAAELKELREEFSDQFTLEDEMEAADSLDNIKATVRVNGGEEMSLGEFERRLKRRPRSGSVTEHIASVNRPT